MKDNKLMTKLRNLPDSPGVYKFLNEKGEIIYVGKARRLKRRVMSYFQSGRARDARLQMLVNEVIDLEIIRASSEAEALIYEAGLIKDHSPKYNIDLKDDKSYPYLKLTINEKYPRIFITRRRKGDGAIYYGPYVNVNLLNEALDFMKKLFPLRTCSRFHKTVCLEYHIGHCYGPCEKKISHKEYLFLVSQLRNFLEGKKDSLIASMQDEMKSCSEKKDYEKALELKRRIEALSAMHQLHDRSQYPIFGELDELQNALDLDNLPVSIECFDISNISGTLAVGSMVKFVGGKARRSDYRRFKIKNVKGIDDYSMMREVVRRRYSRLKNDGKVMPDLILIDGGRGHLQAAKDELVSLGLSTLPVCSIAKEHNNLYVENRKLPIRLSPGSRILLLIQRIRDEAHRFAITYHRNLRGKDSLNTELRKIKGIGKVKEFLLLEKFGNISNIRDATAEELKSAGIDCRTARAVVNHFRGKSNPKLKK